VFVALIRNYNSKLKRERLYA